MTALGRGVVEAIVINVLREGPMRIKAIARLEGLKEGSVWRCIDRMHKAGEVHIVKWHTFYMSAEGKPIGGRWAPIYALGPGEDEPYPDTRQMYRAAQKRFYRKWRSLGGKGKRTPDKGIKELRREKQDEQNDDKGRVAQVS